jgi:hypothetical protein
MIDMAAVLKLTVMRLHQKHLEINYTIRLPSVWRQTVSAYSFKPYYIMTVVDYSCFDTVGKKVIRLKTSVL